LEICLKARRQKPTLKMAFTLPVSIATIIMLMSPLMGDLNTQALIKLVTVALQTICFLFLCSQAPTTGFGKTKPKICEHDAMGAIRTTRYKPKPKPKPNLGSSFLLGILGQTGLTMGLMTSRSQSRRSHQERRTKTK
jgi:hypothetical protein